MSRIITFTAYSVNGEVIEQRWCGETCYNDKLHGKTCICHGMNTGVGKAVAISNAKEFGQVWYQDWIDSGIAVNPDVLETWVYFQEPLPGLEYLEKTPA